MADGATIPFGQTFAEVPTVVACHNGSSTAINVSTTNITTTGFQVGHHAGSGVSIAWIAAGKR